MIPRVLRLMFLVAVCVVAALPAFAQESGRRIEVVDLSGPFDDRLLEFAIETIEAAGTDGAVEAVILQIDSPGTVAGEDPLKELAALIAEPPLPVVAWVGPAPAVAQGGVAQLYSLAPLRAAAPGTEIGLWEPTIAGRDPGFLLVEPPSADLITQKITVDAPIPELVDLVSADTAAPRQLAQLIDGMEIAGQTVETVEPFTSDEGVEGVTVVTMVNRGPGLWDRFLRLASTPEAAFFFLVAGLTIAAFEFYAIGPGIASGVASVLLLIGGYGLATLPVHWWAVMLAIVSVLVMAYSYQRGGILVISWLGLIGLTVAGFTMSATSPQITPGIPSVLLTIVGAAFFFLLAMPTVARSRFSTQTIGREALIGRRGIAIDSLSPDGVVEVEGAHWRATSHREAGIAPGDVVEVVGVDGWYLEVEPTG